MTPELYLPIVSHHCRTTHSACDCVLKSLDDLSRENEALRAVAASAKAAVLNIRDVLNAGDGIEIYCDVNPEDCDHCVAEHWIDEALTALERTCPST